MTSMLRSPTFVVDTERQQNLLDNFHKSDQQLSEELSKSKPLCFCANTFQKTHPEKLRQGHKDADRTCLTPMCLGVADGVSQIADFGIDASILPEELLANCADLAMAGLIPNGEVSGADTYTGPIALMRDAYEATDCLGSTTVCLAIMDNINTYIHGKMHPMIAVIAVGDCELLVLRRRKGRSSALEAVFHTEMQRIDGNAQSPLQLARLDDEIDPNFDESMTLEVIERGSAVHCISAYEGDILVMGSDGVFDNLFLDEIVEACNAMLPTSSSGRFEPAGEGLLGRISQKLVSMCHAKTEQTANGFMPEAPIGRGGKVDDTAVVVAEIVEWSDEHLRVWAPRARSWGWGLFDCKSNACSTVDMDDDKRTESEDEERVPSKPRRPESGEDESACSIS